MKRFEFADFQTAQTKLCTAVRKANIQCKSLKAKFKRFFFWSNFTENFSFFFFFKKKQHFRAGEIFLNVDLMQLDGQSTAPAQLSRASSAQRGEDGLLSPLWAARCAPRGTRSLCRCCKALGWEPPAQFSWRWLHCTETVVCSCFTKTSLYRCKESGSSTGIPVTSGRAWILPDASHLLHGVGWTKRPERTQAPKPCLWSVASANGLWQLIKLGCPRYILPFV